MSIRPFQKSCAECHRNDVFFPSVWQTIGGTMLLMPGPLCANCVKEDNPMEEEDQVAGDEEEVVRMRSSPRVHFAPDVK